LLRAITFDFWDTLYKAPQGQDQAGRRVAAFKQVLRSMGHMVKEEAIRAAILASWRYANDYQREYGLDITPKGHLDFLLQHLRLDLTLPEWQLAYQVYTSSLLGHPPRLNEGVLDTLPRLAGTYKLGLICNTGISPGKVLREIMQADDIFGWFDFMVFSDEVGWAKPNVKIFNYALENLQVKNTEAAHVGDDSITDITGAKKAGMTAVWLAPEGINRCTDCDYQIRSIDDLIDLFGA
jgi:FMN phosphatase YigB (HAD superfamily)